MEAATGAASLDTRQACPLPAASSPIGIGYLVMPFIEFLIILINLKKPKIKTWLMSAVELLCSTTKAVPAGSGMQAVPRPWDNHLEVPTLSSSAIIRQNTAQKCWEFACTTLRKIRSPPEVAHFIRILFRKTHCLCCPHRVVPKDCSEIRCLRMIHT